MKESHLGVELACDIYPNGCSCGIDYEGNNQTYKEHLLEKHTTKINI